MGVNFKTLTPPFNIGGSTGPVLSPVRVGHNNTQQAIHRQQQHEVRLKNPSARRWEFGFTLDLVSSFPDTDHRLIVATWHQSEGDLMRSDPIGYNTLIKLRQSHAERVKIMFEVHPSELPKDKLRDFHFTDIVFNLLPNSDGTGREW